MDKLITIFKIPELRRKILFTALLLAIYRIGFYVPLPIVNQAQLRNWEEQLSTNAAGKIFGTVAMFGGTSIGMSTIFGLGIMPYISASIIFQLLGSVVPSLEAMMKEGESGRKRINEYTRYATVVLCAVQSAFWVQYMMSPQMNVVLPEYRDIWHGMVSVSIMTAGTVFLMWVGEQIDEYGIGNGISLLIMAGILSRLPVALQGLWQNATTRLTPEPGKYGIITIALLLILFVAVVVGVVAITESQRRIPTQSAKHVRGRRVFGGTRQYLPLKVNQAGVMPIIFASSLLIFPSLILSALARSTASLRSDTWSIGSFFATTLQDLADAFQRQGYLYTLSNIVMIYFFCYFWTAITFNPKDMSENLKDYGSFIPGYRPGRRTAEYLEKVMLRITYVGAAFLSLVAVIPTLVQNGLNVDFTVAQFLGGTGLLIVVSVCLDLVQKIDSHLVMRNYSGLVNRK
ncbi:preprotein translocase subunit SecY [Planctomyces sp. SH-PL62]|uniref:preprotein translocase subunit SecY n=1 Tax=Planctomyces sp. SH-PL62 TaxID=1636152 RepID=UPI00078EC18B|nr:preprotein translocase subunit SecY [Planctomyces sp. SH-PL62]AMV36029.1 preprotein translocase subunit SecY [Planctomyces sp. SH-PL62]